MITAFSAYNSPFCGEIKKPPAGVLNLVGSEELAKYAFASAEAALKAKQGKLKLTLLVLALPGIQVDKLTKLKTP